MSVDRPFDAGLQPERTLLAWRRTALALGVAAVVAARLTLAVIGIAGVLVGLLGVIAALAAYVFAARRYRSVHAGLSAGRAVLASDGSAMASAAVATGALSIVALVYVLASGLGGLG